MIKIAVTGGIACGKSTVGGMLAEDGVDVCDADDLAHAALARGSEVYRAVAEAFGPDVLDGRGEIDRAALGRRVFGNECERGMLNAIVHPAVRCAWEDWLASRSSTLRMAAVIVPLLFEGGFDVGWDAVVCVSAPRRVQLERLRRRGCGVADAELRMAAQMGRREREVRADVVIANAGEMNLLRRQVERMMRGMLETR